MINFLQVFYHYLIEILPALAIGFLISGLVHEFVPTSLVQKYLGTRGVFPILWATVIGTILPVCCWGSLPIALSFYKKGSRLGPVLAFLVATPATSISALMVSYRLLGLNFTIYIFFSVIVMGLIIGIIGNFLKYIPKKKAEEICSHCNEKEDGCVCSNKNVEKIKNIFRFAFISMPKEIGLELLIGILLAAIVASITPIGKIINNYLFGLWAYPFSLIFGLLMYFCSTASVPLVHALINQGMNIGAGFVLLLVGPITSYGTILILRKEFGSKILLYYLISICILATSLGYIYSIL